jgi:hypothetical protein
VMREAKYHGMSFGVAPVPFKAVKGDFLFVTAHSFETGEIRIDCENGDIDFNSIKVRGTWL